MWLRLQPQDFRVRPYAEAVVGFKGLFTDYSLRFEQGVGTTSATSDQDLTSSAGLGAGVEILLATDDSSGRLYATLGFRWLHGGKASFDRAAPVPDAATVSASFNVPTTTTVVMLGIAATWDLLAHAPQLRWTSSPDSLVAWDGA